jgi:hypothetical protein
MKLMRNSYGSKGEYPHYSLPIEAVLAEREKFRIALAAKS